MQKYRIVHIITRLIAGGAEQNTIITVQWLKKHGYEASLISGFPVGAEGSLIKEAQDRGINLHLVSSLVREISPIKDLQAFFSIFTILRKEKPTIVHTHCSKAGIVGRWAAFWVGVPYIYHTPHGHIYSHGRFNFSRFFTRLCLYLERLTSCFTDKIFVLSDVEREESLLLGISRKREKFVKVHSGVEIEKFRNVRVDVPQKKSSLVGLPPEAKVVGTVGRLVPLKGHRYFLSCIPKVLDAFPKAKFLIVGDGELRQELEKQTVHLGIERYVLFTGLRKDVPEILKCLDVFVLASTHEAMGRVLVEAMASGLPVVATNVGGVPEVVEQGVTGFLVPPASPACLADAIIHLLRDKNLAKKMGERGKIQAANFSAERMVERIINTYLSLLLKRE